MSQVHFDYSAVDLDSNDYPLHPEGRFLLEIQAAEERVAASGVKYVKMEIESVSDESIGRIFYNLMLEAKSSRPEAVMAVSKNVLLFVQACGITLSADKQLNFDPEIDLEGRRFVANIQHVENTYTTRKGVEKKEIRAEIEGYSYKHPDACSDYVGYTGDAAEKYPRRIDAPATDSEKSEAAALVFAKGDAVLYDNPDYNPIKGVVEKVDKGVLSIKDDKGDVFDDCEIEFCEKVK